MKLKSVEIENYRAIEKLRLPLDPALTVFHGDNAHGKTSILSAIAVGLGSIPTLLPDVSGIGFLETDRRQERLLQVKLTTVDGITWRRTRGPRGPRAALQELNEAMRNIVSSACEGHEPLDLPIVVFYDTNRAVFDQLRHRGKGKTKFPRYAALEGALSARTNFREFFEWFYTRENEELREQKAHRNFDFRLKDLNAVRQAIARMVRGVSDPHIELGPLRFVVSVKAKRKTEKLVMNQLSGGCRIMLALTADLAWRMAQGNPHLKDPLASEAIVLIDEIELHLHPSWQQCVLTDLRRTFPNAQFIVSTHSPQVLTDVRPEQVVKLCREDDGIVAIGADAPTYGAEAGNVLEMVMGVDERPPHNKFTKDLSKYMRMIDDDKGETEPARKLRRKLEQISPHDPGLDRADMELRRRKLFAKTSDSR